MRRITERRSSTEDFQKVRPVEAHTRDDTFDVGASSNPTKFSKLLKIIKQYIQKTYKDPDDMVKTIHQMTEIQIQTCLRWPYLHGNAQSDQRVQRREFDDPLPKHAQTRA